MGKSSAPHLRKQFPPSALGCRPSRIKKKSEYRMEGEVENNGKMVRCQFSDAEGTNLGPAMNICQNYGPRDLTELVNALRDDGEKHPYAFYILDQELLVDLGSYLTKNKVSMEKDLTIVYQPQAVFRIRPVSRCSATIAGHTNSVLTVAFSPDGQQLASGSGDKTVRFWDLNTQTPLFTCKGHNDWVLSVAWSPDGRHLVSGSMAGELQCWDPKTGLAAGNQLTGHKQWITGISWEPLHLNSPCRRFVSSSKDGDARIWDIILRKCVTILTGHKGAVTCVKWGGEGLIYTGSQDRTIKVWETSQGKQIHELKGHAHWVNTLSLSTEYVLRTGAFDHSRKHFSSPEEMQKVALERYNKARGNAPERLVSGSDDMTIILWKPSFSKDPICQLSNDSKTDPKTQETGHKTQETGHKQLVNHVYFSPDGQWIASASFDKSIKLWNGATGKFCKTFEGHVGGVYQLSWSADSRLLLSGSKDSTLKVWDIQTKKVKQDLPGHADEVYAVDWSPDGEKVASGGKDKKLKLWMG